VKREKGKRKCETRKEIGWQMAGGMDLKIFCDNLILCIFLVVFIGKCLYILGQ